MTAGAGDELVEVAEEVGPVAKGVAEDEVVVVAHHDELVELDAVLGGAVGEAILENLAGVGVRSEEKLPPGASPRTEDDVARRDLSGAGHAGSSAFTEGRCVGSSGKRQALAPTPPKGPWVRVLDPAERTLGSGSGFWRRKDPGFGFCGF